MRYVEVVKNKWAQLVIAFVIGAAIGVIFYPSKSIEQREKIQELEKYSLKLEKDLKERAEKLDKAQEEIISISVSLKEVQEQTTQKIDSLRTENRELRQSAKRQKFKLVKPDGTIVEKEYEESQSEQITSVVTEIRQEFDRKVQSIENRWKSAYERRLKSIKTEYEKKLEETKVETKVVEKIVEKEKIIKVNEKKLRTEIGYSSNEKIHVHTSYPIWGPLFFGGGASWNTDLTESEVRVGLGVEW
jgi:uncharacterized membrane-anchored protein YhcB (DUF1043 family)